MRPSASWRDSTHGDCLPIWTAEDAALLQAIDDATATPIFIFYALGPEWADGVHAVIDDSDGWTVQFCKRLLPLHRDAAAAARVSTAEIADREGSFERFDSNPFAEMG